jgi:hypothetical protein
MMAAFALSIGNLWGADVERGKLLHENHCRMCHDSIAYKRTGKIAHTYAEVKAQVTRWQTNTGLRWSAEDIENVTAYVAATYYGLAVPSKP